MRKLLLAGGLLLCMGLIALAQTVFTLNLSGNEAILIQIGGAGGGSGYTTTAVLRNSTGYVQVPGGATVNTSMTNLAAKAISIGVITTWNVQFPPNPFDGELVEVACPGGTATVSMITVSPTTITGSAFTACTSIATGEAEWIWAISPNTWYRVQ